MLVLVVGNCGAAACMQLLFLAFDTDTDTDILARMSVSV